MLTLPHSSGCRRSKVDQIAQPGEKHRRQWYEDIRSIRQLHHAFEAGVRPGHGCPNAGEGERKDDGKSGLDAEVDREDASLQCCECGSWKDFVGHYATNE